MRYLPHTEDEIREMLERVGVERIDDLFEPIPASHRLERPLALEPALSEPALMRHISELGRRNEGPQMLSFLGAGCYEHHIPPAVDQLLLRSEFYTAYTPYQPELSQGTLQAIFEFQTVVTQLFGLEVANASMYDFASAAAEAVLMARRVTRRSAVTLSAGLHPHCLETIRTYVSGIDASPSIALAPIGADGRTELDALRASIGPDTAAVVIGYPNFYGCVEDLAAIQAVCEQHGAPLISVTMEPYALALIEAPGVLGADIAVGEGQPMAVPPQYGGPGVGLFACRQKFARQMPGRTHAG